ncbi:MAG TPA: hypothetical protein VGP93_17120, partial [Polyangiaceae bacterium]|nr:hypothetical protein [Polyangiaceae bacterium]
SFNNAQPDRARALLRRDEFDSDEEALTHAKRLVDRALEQLGAVSSAHELMTQYARRGSEVPIIYGEPRIAFHAYQCAREKANAMFASPS